MLIRTLKFTTVLFVLVAFFVVTTCVFSQDPFWESSYTTYNDKQCDDPLDPYRKHDGKNSICSTFNTSKDKCGKAKKPKYDLVETDGCTVNAPAYTDDSGTTFYYYCYLGEVKYSWGTVKCKFTKTLGQKDKCEPDDTTWSKKNKKAKACRNLVA